MHDSFLAEEKGKELAEKLRTQGQKGELSVFLLPMWENCPDCSAKTIPESVQDKFRSVAETGRTVSPAAALPYGRVDEVLKRLIRMNSRSYF